MEVESCFSAADSVRFGEDGVFTPFTAWYKEAGCLQKPLADITHPFCQAIRLDSKGLAQKGLVTNLDLEVNIVCNFVRCVASS